MQQTSALAMHRFALVAVLTAAAGLAGCDMLGMESAEKVAAQRDAEGRAIGGACRHANRAIEDCYALNKKADKSAVFSGWRDMNDYMRENKIEPVPPQLGTAAPKAKPAEGDEKAEKPEKPEKSGEKDKAEAKKGDH
jgi:hypothetical protein